jgi:NhaP-type Na+/H+ or K+/H+ antiporter
MKNTMTTILFNVNFELLADTMKTFLLCSALGLYIRFLISFVSNQKWLKNYSQFLVFALLPLTGYLITSVISNNIALSLGMVGALSIVRFRTPVKNPSELVIYFILITIGIVVNVNGNLAINFVIFITIMTVLTEIYKLISNKLNLQEFSFNEDNKTYLKIHTSEENISVLDHKELNHFSSDGEFLYIFASNKREVLETILNSFDKNKLISYSLDIAN